MILLERELGFLRQRVLSLGGLVEAALKDSLRALRERDQKLAASVEAADEVIDAKEVDVEEDCLKLLALHQPVAIDLRFVVAVIKLTNDLERIGDLAVDIAQRAHQLAGRDPVPLPPEIAEMSRRVETMVRESLDALVHVDADLARRICGEDDAVDEAHRRMFQWTQKMAVEQPERIEQWLAILSVSRYLERIADHSTNIAEDVLYLVKGEIVRHRVKDTLPP